LDRNKKILTFCENYLLCMICCLFDVRLALSFSFAVTLSLPPSLSFFFSLPPSYSFQFPILNYFPRSLSLSLSHSPSFPLSLTLSLPLSDKKWCLSVLPLFWQLALNLPLSPFHVCLRVNEFKKLQLILSFCDIQNNVYTNWTFFPCHFKRTRNEKKGFVCSKQFKLRFPL